MSFEDFIEDSVINLENHYIIIGIYLKYIKYNDIIPILEKNIIEQYNTYKISNPVHKDKLFYIYTLNLDRFKDANLFIKTDLIQKVKLIESYTKEQTKHINFDNDSKIFNIQRLNKKFNIQLNDIQFVNLYYYFSQTNKNNKLHKKEPINSSIKYTVETPLSIYNEDLLEYSDTPESPPIVIKENRAVVIKENRPVVIKENRPVVIKENRPVVIKEKLKCGCKYVKIVKNIYYCENNCIPLHSIFYSTNHNKIYLYSQSRMEIFQGFVHKNIYKNGSYKKYLKNHTLYYEIEYRGDLYKNTKTNNYMPHGYCDVRKFDKQNKLICHKSGEYSFGTYKDDFGNINDKCAECKVHSPNIICFKCKQYLCLECDKKIHYSIMKQNKIMGHIRNFFDINVIYEHPRYAIDLRHIIIKEDDVLYSVKHKLKNKKLVITNKQKYAPKILYYKTDTNYEVCDKIIELMKSYTDDLNIPFEDVKDIMTLINFKIQLDTILQ